MLVLSRREGEKIVFPSIGVSLEVVRIKGNTARLGIQAPSSVPVLREELLRKNLENGRSIPFAAAAAADAKSGKGSPAVDTTGIVAARVGFGQNVDRQVVAQRVATAGKALDLFHGQIASGEVGAAQKTFHEVVALLRQLERECEASITASQESAQDCARPDTPDQNGEDARLRGRSALLVEDDRNEAELLAGLLRMHGVDVTTAGDGADALDYLSSNSQPDIVLLDMIMPRYDGPATIDAIRQSPTLKDLRVFAISGTSPSSLGVNTGPNGIDRWFQKPVNPEALVRELTVELAG